MAITVNPTLPVIAATPAASTPGLALQPGTVVNAQVLNTLAENLVQIAIAGLSIDVLSEVPLQAGQNLQLAVSQTASGIRLAIVPPDSQAASGAYLDAVTLTPNAPVAAPATSPADPASQINQLSPLERAAVAVAAETAVTQQGSQAPLFANLSSLAASNSLPPPLQQAVLQVLAQRTPLDPSLGGSDIQNAFQKSGLLLEASLASGSVSPASGIPDLKAALIVLRQTLVTSLSATESPAPPPPQPAVPGTAAAVASGAVSARTQTAHEAPPLAPSAPEIDVQEILLPQARPAVVEGTVNAASAGRIVLTEALLATEPRSATTGTVLNLPQEALQEIPRAAGNASSATVTLQNGRSEEAIARTNTPPPPFRGALPSAQPLPRRRSQQTRRSPRPRIICLTIPTPRSPARRCCRWPRCRARPIRPRRGSIRPRRAGISKSRLRRRRGRRWRSSRFRATAAATRLRRPSGCGGRGSRSTSSRPARSMRWFRSPASGLRCGCGRSGRRPRRNCAPARRNSARR